MARCKHCDKFILIKHNSGYCKGCEDYLKAESIKRQAYAAEEARRLEEECKQAEEAERIRLAEEARLRQEAEEARRLEEERKQAEEAERIRLAEEARLHQEFEEAHKMERDRLQSIQWINRLKMEQEERLRLKAEREQTQKDALLHREATRVQQLQHEADEKERLEQEHHQAEELARRLMVLDPKEYLKEQTEILLHEIQKDQPDLYVIPRKGYTAIRRKLWDSTADSQYIAKVRYTTNALVVAVSTRAPEFDNAQQMVAANYIEVEQPEALSENLGNWLELFVEAAKAEKFFGSLLQPRPAADAEKPREVSTEAICPEIYKDVDIEQLSLSQRAYSRLKRNGIHTLGALCELSETDLRSFSQLGRVTITEILQRRSEYVTELIKGSQSRATMARPAECPENGKDIPLDRLGLSVRAYNGLSRSGIKTFGELCQLTEEELSQIQNLGKLSVKEILQCRESWKSILLSNGVSAITITETTEDSEVVESVTLPVRSFIEYIHSLTDERMKTVVLQRAYGKKLEELSAQMNVSRERVRQFEKRFWDRAAWGAESFIEEKYVPLLAKYQISEKEFRAIFDEPREAWYIVTKLSKRTNEDLLPLEDAVLDDTISSELRTLIQAFCQSIADKTFIEIDGISIPAVRSDVERYMLSHYCLDEMIIDDFIKKYNDILIEAGYSDDHLLITEAVRNTRYNAIFDSSDVLCSFMRRIRYYPIGNYDIPAFITALNLDLYQDIEISARKLMLDHPALMEKYDIRNEYELHNLLRKQEVDKLIPGMVFGKMPMIRFGETDRTSFILDLLFELAPIGRDDFAIAVSEITGERPDFVLSKIEYWEAINVYLHNDMLTIDSEEMPDQEKQTLLAALHEDCYTLEEIESIYKRVTGNSDERLLSPYNLKKLGFKVYSGYVVRNYPTAHKYFRDILTRNEIVDYSKYAERYASLGEWGSTLNLLKDRYEVIEFAPYQLVRKDRLVKFGVTVESLQAFCDEAYHFTEPEQYFTICSLRNAGFDSSLFALGFEDWFYSSILREDPRFGNTRVGTREAPALIFCRDAEQVTRQSFIEYLLDGGSMDRDDLFSLIQDEYGVIMDKHDIFQILNESSMYYDPTMGKVYADKELYYEEV